MSCLISALTCSTVQRPIRGVHFTETIKGDGVQWEEHPAMFFKLTDYAWDEKRVRFEKNPAFQPS
ncbi:MAG: hypothetical protein D4S01_02860 [Dehalococcoidia bacterium]|nr:MAG: hypothetical protein D4S01_02860 [Dehalococcoidia bacterium]